MTDLAVPDNRKKAVALGSPQSDFDAAYRLAQNLSLSNLIPAALQGKAPNVLVAILYGQELGLAPMQSIQSIYVVNGKPSISGQLWLAKVREAGHKIEVKHGKDECTVTITRKDDGNSHTEMFSLADAKRAGLADKEIWKKYPKRMLMWRAVSDCATVICPEVALGFQMTESMPDRDERPTLAQVAAEREDRPEQPAEAEVVDAPSDPDIEAQVAEIEAEHVDGIRAEEGLPFPPEDETS